MRQGLKGGAFFKLWAIWAISGSEANKFPQVTGLREF